MFADRPPAVGLLLPPDASTRASGEARMLTACWSAKGGVGTTVVSAALALLAARSEPTGALLVDLAGDAPAVLGLNDTTARGVADWLARAEAPADGLARLEVAAAPGLALLPRGEAAISGTEGLDVLVDLLTADSRTVVADCGVLVGAAAAHPLTGVATGLAASAGCSLLVLRPCYLAMRHALAAPLRPSGVVLVAEPDRSLTVADVEEVLDVPVLAVLRVDAAVARAVDAGLLASRLPKILERGLRRVA